MFRHCVAGIDFSAGWDQLRGQLGRMIALLGIQQLTLVHADEPHLRAHQDSDDCERRRLSLEQVAGDLQAELGIAVQPRFVTGFAASAILEVAGELQADLVMAANRSHSRGGELFLGNVALNLARMSTLPLLIVPRDLGAIEEHAPLLLVSDRSAAGRAARDCFAALLGSQRKGRVMVIGDPGDPGEQASLAELEAVEALVSSHANITPESVAGDPLEAICQAAAALHTPLILLGKPRRAPVDAAPLAALVEDVCRQARNPLLLVPA